MCDIQYHLHENAAKVLQNDVGLRTLNELRQNAENMLLDPAVHNSLVSLMDTMVEVGTNPNFLETLNNVFYWVHQLVHDNQFRLVWSETMKGVQMMFDNHAIARQVGDALFDNVEKLLHSEYFDSSYDAVLRDISSVVNMRRNLMFSAGAVLSKAAGQRSLSPSRSFARNAA